MMTQPRSSTAAKTLAQRYNAEAQRLMPQIGQDLLVDPAITWTCPEKVESTN